MLLLKVKSFIATRIYRFSLYLRAAISYVIPKKKDLYIFFPTHERNKLSGNIKALILYISQHQKEIDTVVVSDRAKVREEAMNYGLKTVSFKYGYSWKIFRAEHIVVDASVGLYFGRGNYSLIQVWHGVGFKNIGLLNDNKTKKEYKSLEKDYKKFQCVIASSVEDQKRKFDSFRCNNTAITGSPRNDLFFTVNQKTIDEIKKRHSLHNYSQIFTYAPTFRDFETRPPFSDQFWQKLDDSLISRNAVLTIKKHPGDKYLRVPQGLRSVVDLSEEIDDVQNLLLITDVLITDYSSISTDYSLTKRPIIIYDYDLDEYMAYCRSMYYDFKKIMPKPSVQSEEELLRLLIDDEWRCRKDIIESQERFRNMFHAYIDGNSSERVFLEIKKL